MVPAEVFAVLVARRAGQPRKPSRADRRGAVTPPESTKRAGEIWCGLPSPCSLRASVAAASARSGTGLGSLRFTLLRPEN